MMPSVRVVLLTLSVAFGTVAHAQSPAPTAPQAASKPGYMVVIGNGVDPKRMGAYASAAVPLLLKYQGKLMFATEEGQTEVLEGGLERIPSRDSAARGQWQD
jgi:hypothetical protein